MKNKMNIRVLSGMLALLFFGSAFAVPGNAVRAAEAVPAAEEIAAETEAIAPEAVIAEEAVEQETVTIEEAVEQETVTVDEGTEQEDVIPEDAQQPEMLSVVPDAEEVSEDIAEEITEDIAEDIAEDIPEDAVALEDADILTADLTLPDGEELFAAYTERLFYEEDEEVDSFPVYYVSRRTNLTGGAATIYDAMKPIITKVAAGENITPTKTFTMKQLGLKSQYSLKELGVSSANNKVWEALLEKAGVRKAFDALITDLPYELYWFDKEIGYRQEGTGVKHSGSTIYTSEGKFTFTLAVSADYSASGGTGTFKVNTKKTGAASAAKTRAQAIVKKHASKSDLEKVTAYRDEICNLTEYNKKAVTSNPPYGDPWQLIHVFDGDSSTNVVCEGYSKAFQYLCDLSTFKDYRTTCFTVTGDMNGGPHMWNILQMDNGYRYLADITNCDGNNRNLLFLKGAPKGSASGYTISGIVYSYSDETKRTFEARERTLSKSADYATDKKKGLQQADGKWRKDSKGWWYRRVNGTYPKNRWERIEGKWYHFDKNGYMQTGWKKIDKKWYYLGTDGAMRTGWIKVSGKWYYMDKNGAMQTGWKKISKKWYYLGSDGVMRTGWTKVAGKYYYMDKNGAMQTGWIKLSKKWYYLGTDGMMATGWKKLSNKWYYFGSDGAMRTGWAKVSGKFYYMDKNGVLQTGWKKLSGKWYYLDAKTGAMATGWKKVDGKQYYFGSDGAMRTGWTKVSGKYYYMDKNGVVQTGWIKLSKKWYYLGTDGMMATGWKKIDKKWYYFGSDGVMRTGWTKVSGKYYYMDKNGVVQTGWKKLDGKWYYLGSDGAMVANTSKKIDGKIYKFDKSGVCTNP